MHLKRLELNGFKSFAKKSEFIFDVPIIAIVGPNGSGKSNVVESIRFVLGEQSVKSMRGKTGSDLIFKGSQKIAKMSRASVHIVFDNKDRVFQIHQGGANHINVDFDEVVIGREVFADGGNKYTINGNEVRMKDIHELIASINIGASGHHIISQGEADRYLNANTKDRRELIEEALGLRVYQYRIKESVKKLEKAELNIKESELLRRELAPHLKFLKRQVDKIEKTKKLREILKEKYRNYFAKEEFFIKNISTEISQKKALLQNKIEEVDIFLKKQGDPDKKKEHQELNLIREKNIILRDLQRELSSMDREIGRLDGMISLLEKQKNKRKEREENKKDLMFSYAQLQDLFRKVNELLELISAQNLQKIILEIKNTFTYFVQDNKNTQEDSSQEEREIESFLLEKKSLEYKKEEIISEIKKREEEISILREVLEKKEKEERDGQKQYYFYLSQKKELTIKQDILFEQERNLLQRKERFLEEQEESIVLLGEEISYQKIVIEVGKNISQEQQENLRRELERIKIRIEDMGGGSGGEILQEYEENLARDKFLEKEISDTEETIATLHKIIKDLKGELRKEFEVGMKKINIQFDRFFKLMFGGGSAHLTFSLIQKRKKKNNLIEGEQAVLLEEEENKEKEYGIDIQVKLPRKKVSDLQMLSGGERSLTSIALLFALSQVNPPPFLILDETDAALDEANSQKYGDMIEELSKFSQLIVVTHNRETMSRAQTLFGVTLGRDDASTMLSLRLEDAEKYAK